MTLINVTTGNVAKVAAITPFLRFYSDDNPGKRDYNSDKQHVEGRSGQVTVRVRSGTGRQSAVQTFLLGEICTIILVIGYT
jgi:hypothetical protein